jgi:signal transduction histidine kinase
MFDYNPENFSEINRAYLDNERAVWVRNFRVACILAFIFVPAGSSLDYWMYPHFFAEFLCFRLVCSALLLFIWWLVKTPVGLRFYRVLGLILPALPTICCALMIYRTTGENSPYYAGLNLVLLGAAIILRWTFVDSLLAFLEALGLYLVACISHGPIKEPNLFFNNIYFIVVTGVFVVIGSYFYNRLRFREFAFRYELDKSKQELEETNRKLVELDQFKSRFFANVSHELRTPLTLLLAPLESLIHKYQDRLDAAARETLLTMQSNGMRLLKLINDLLDLIRLESGRLQVKSEVIALPEFISGLASAVRQISVAKKITLETKVDPALNAILGDRDKLEKIALNLLFNALKFTPEGGHIWLLAEKQGNEYVLIVKDSGVGIAEKSLPFVFDRFWQEDSSSKRKFQGAGIGLALVKELVEIQNGTVSVQSQENKGATFTVRLPYFKADIMAGKMASATQNTVSPERLEHGEEWLVNLYRRAELFPALAVAKQSTGTTTFLRRTQRPVILVADDEPDMRRFLKSQLEETYEVVEAVDGQDATNKTHEVMPDLILLDLMMPHKDGLQVCRELREYAPTAGIPIILLTARADEEAKFDALQMGANDFLAKPFSSVELQARVKNLIERHRDQRKLSKQNEELSDAIEQIKETELQLVQSEKLSSLGRLSAGIIHEINNPLNYSLTGLFALRNKGKNFPPEQRAEFDEIVNDVEEGIKRVRNIVSDLRTFTHPGGGTGEPVEVADTVQAAMRFLAGEWRDKAVIHQQVPPEQLLWGNRNKLIHVLVNLMQNAIDALGEKTFADGEKPQIWISGRTEGTRSLIVVRDNGPGIEKKVEDKIFDPFFTTKDPGKGMGLGLSICYRIVQGYGGKISVRSERGQFCEFTLDFPATAKAAEEMNFEHGEPLRL